MKTLFVSSTLIRFPAVEGDTIRCVVYSAVNINSSPKEEERESEREVEGI